MGPSRAFIGVTTALLVCGSPYAAFGVEPSAGSRQSEAASTAMPQPRLSEELSALRDDVGAIWLQLDRLSDGETAPTWASQEHGRLENRLERLTATVERLSAQVETPVPRLDEPLTLLTVSVCTLILGFLAGRSLQRRSNRKDSRFRL